MRRTRRTPRWFGDVADEVWVTIGVVLAIAALVITVALLDFPGLGTLLPIRSP